MRCFLARRHRQGSKHNRPSASPQILRGFARCPPGAGRDRPTSYPGTFGAEHIRNVRQRIGRLRHQRKQLRRHAGRALLSELDSQCFQAPLKKGLPFGERPPRGRGGSGLRSLPQTRARSFRRRVSDRFLRSKALSNNKSKKDGQRVRFFSKKVGHGPTDCRRWPRSSLRRPSCCRTRT